MQQCEQDKSVVFYDLSQYYVNLMKNCIAYFADRMSGVTKICAHEILDSRGNPTVEVDIVTSKGVN